MYFFYYIAVSKPVLKDYFLLSRQTSSWLFRSLPSPLHRTSSMAPKTSLSLEHRSQLHIHAKKVVLQQQRFQRIQSVHPEKNEQRQYLKRRQFQQENVHSQRLQQSRQIEKQQFCLPKHRKRFEDAQRTWRQQRVQTEVANSCTVKQSSMNERNEFYLFLFYYFLLFSFSL